MKDKKKSIERRRLLDAGWEPKEEGSGKTLWLNPKNGFWDPQRVAIVLLGEGTEPEDIPRMRRGGASVKWPRTAGYGIQALERPGAPHALIHRSSCKWCSPRFARKELKVLRAAGPTAPPPQPSGLAAIQSGTRGGEGRERNKGPSTRLYFYFGVPHARGQTLAVNQLTSEGPHAVRLC